MGKMIDLTNKRFERLLVLERTDEKHNDGYVHWKCQCNCGNTTIVSRRNLVDGVTQSCGCLHQEIFNNYVHYDGTSPARIMSEAIQVNNTSGVRGVSRNKKDRKWESYISFKGKRYHLKSCSDLDDAIKIRKQAEEKIFGEFLEWYYSIYPNYHR